MYNVQDYNVLYDKVVRQGACEGWHFTHNGKQLHDPIISIRGKVWAHKTSLAPSLVIEVPVPSQESKWPYICVRCVDFASIHSVQDIWKIEKNGVWFVYKDIFMYDIYYVLVMIYVWVMLVIEDSTVTVKCRTTIKIYLCRIYSTY
jgi:hypothetical protein